MGYGYFIYKGPNPIEWRGGFKTASDARRSAMPYCLKISKGRYGAEVEIYKGGPNKIIKGAQNIGDWGYGIGSMWYEGGGFNYAGFNNSRWVHYVNPDGSIGRVSIDMKA